MGDDDELAVVDETVEHFDEAIDVGFIKGRIQLIKHAERTRLDHVDREQQSHRSHRSLTTRKQCDRLQFLAWRFGDDLDATF